MKQAHIDFWLSELEPFTTAIVGNGEVPSSELSIRLLRKMKRVVCCDGALQKLLSVNIIPDVVVGDGDSMDREELSRHSIPYHMAPGKLFDPARAEAFDAPNRLILPAGEEISLE